MSVTTPPPFAPGGASSIGPSASSPSPPASEPCPLCGAPLLGAQDWCLSCGAAARTRLASPPRWRPVVVAFASVICLSLGALAAALVALAGDGGSSTVSTKIVTAASAPASAQTAPASPFAGASAAARAVPDGGAPKTITPRSSRTGSRTASTSRRARSLGAGRTELERLLDAGARGRAGRRRAKLPLGGVPGVGVKTPRIKAPAIKLPQLPAPASAR